MTPQLTENTPAVRSPVRWGMLGHSKFARGCIVPAFRIASGCELAAVASRRGHALEATAADFPSLQVYSDYDALLADPSLDAVYVGLPHAHHCDWSIAALEKGKHVLCEKPLALTAAECRRMIAAAQGSGRLLTEAFMYRLSPALRQLEEVIVRGTLGELRHVNATFSFPLQDEHSTRLVPELGGGALHDVGCYTLNLIGLIADLSAASAPGATRPLDATATAVFRRGVDVRLAAALRFAHGLTASLYCGFDGPHCQQLEIIGVAGTLRLDGPFRPNHAATLEVTRDGVTERLATVAANAYALQLEHFSSAIRHGHATAVPLAESLRNAEILDSLLSQAHRSQPSSLSPA